jgi:hypothetical protein
MRWGEHVRFATDVAHDINESQHDCAGKKPLVLTMANAGFGSDLHTFTVAMCNAAANNAIVSMQGHWIWLNEDYCQKAQEVDFGVAQKNKDVSSCYFTPTPCFQKLIRGHRVPKKAKIPSALDYIGALGEGNARSCMANTKNSIDAVREGMTEYLFSRLSPAVIHSTAQTIWLLFGQASVPENAISVHVRWGDKHKETALQPMEAYISAVDKLVLDHKLKRPTIFVTTADPSAWVAFQDAARSDWNVIHYADAIPGYNFSRPASDPLAAKNQRSPADDADSLAIPSLIALLISVEARFYVLTTSSNWSRLIDELRKSRRDILCGKCTHMIDLLKGQW